MTETTSSATITIVPRPRSLEQGGPGCTLASPVAMTAGDDVATAGALLGEYLPLDSSGVDAGEPGVTITIDASIGAEGYTLTSDAEGVRITGGDAAGAFYGAQTLLQLLPTAIYGQSDAMTVPLTVPGATIRDQPAFGWRGAMLDVARHFQPVEFVLRYLDLLALHKLNVLHLHLTDDQGWRLRIDRYPKLTEIGGQRSETVLGRPSRDPSRERYDHTPHEGHFSKDDIRRILDHARARHIRVMPEIEVPGHSQAAIAAYPELGNMTEPIEVAKTWGIITHVLNVEEATIAFYRDVFDEVFELFDSPYVHVGGDECPRDEWKASPRVQERMAELRVADEDALQSWFIHQIGEHFTAQGRTLVGWDEILEGGLAPNAVVMSWRGEAGGIAAAQAGHDVIMTSNGHTYFDYYQSDDRVGEPYAFNSTITLERAYQHRPVPAALTPEQAEHVLGAQYQTWTEYIPSTGQLEYQAFPRACAFAETVWAPEPGDYAEFLGRLRTHVQRLDGLNVQYRPLDADG